MDTEPAGRSKGCAGVFLQQRWELCPLSAIRYRAASCFVCSQPGNPRITSEDVMGSGRMDIRHLNQRNAKGRRRFLRTRQITGLEGRAGVQEYVAESPFSYERNCLLYLPKTLEHCRRGSREEAVMVADQIHSLICSTYGHTLVLFTSYTLMGSVYQLLRDSLPFPMVEVWRHPRKKFYGLRPWKMGCCLQPASCWEGVDFPGDMVSSLIIVKLPFAVPDPISEAEKETYDSLESYIQSIIVPDMQKKLRQGFGRAIRQKPIPAWCLF